MSKDNPYGVSEHKTGADKGVVTRDKSEYIHDKFADDVGQSELVSQGTPVSPAVSLSSDVFTDVSTDTIITEDIPSSYCFSPEMPVSPTTDDVVGDTEQMHGDKDYVSYLDNTASFHSTASVTDDTIKPVTEPTISLDKVKSNKSRFFRESKTSSDYISIPNRATAYADVTTADSQLQTKGFAGIEYATPLVDTLREDDTGGEALADLYLLGDETYKTVKRIQASNKKVIQAQTQKAAAQIASQSATQTVAAQGAKQGGKKAGQAVSKAIPPVVWLWIFIGVVVSLVLFMFFGLSSMVASEVVFDMGENTELVLSDPETKNNLDIVAWCKWTAENKHGYVYGAFGQMCTMEYLDQQEARYPGEDEAGGAMRIAGEQWIGKPVYDCIGLIKAYMWFDPETEYITYQSNGFIDCGANSIWDEVKVGESGAIGTIPEMPGVAVWMNGHIGIYIGNGEVIEAQGTETGVVKTKLENGAWTHWLYVPHLEYIQPPTEPTTTTAESE